MEKIQVKKLETVLSNDDIMFKSLSDEEIQNFYETYKTINPDDWEREIIRFDIKTD